MSTLHTLVVAAIEACKAGAIKLVIKGVSTTQQARWIAQLLLLLCCCCCCYCCCCWCCCYLQTIQVITWLLLLPTLLPRHLMWRSWCCVAPSTLHRHQVTSRTWHCCAALHQHAPHDVRVATPTRTARRETNEHQCHQAVGHCTGSMHTATSVDIGRCASSWQRIACCL